jgi:large subunit ribosomal protein L10
MSRADKSATLAEVTDKFRNAAATVLTEYRGLTVTQLKELRRALGPKTTYSVVKNTISRLAAKDAGVEGLDEMLKGPSALAFVEGDPVETAKGLKNFAKENPTLVIKGAYMDGKVLSAKEILRLADLESREVLLAKLAGAMNASLTQAVYLFAAPLSQAARAFGALQAKAQADSSVLAASAPATQTETAEAPVAEAPETEAAEAAEEVTTETVTEGSAQNGEDK